MNPASVRQQKWFSALVLVATALAPQAATQAAETKELVFPAPPDEPRYFFERSIYSSANVEPPKKKSMLEMLAGSAEGGAKALSKPYAVAAKKGKVYVSDSAEGVVHVFDLANQKYSRVGEEGQGDIAKALGLDVDAAGNLYVMDVTSKVVKIYDAEGKFLRDVGNAKVFGSRLASVSVNPEGTRLYVTEIGGVQSPNHRVLVLDAATGNHLFDVGKRGAGAGEFNLPRDVAIGKDGRIYVVDGGNFRIQIFDRDGKYLKSFGEVGKFPGQFSRPKEIAADKEGNIYVVDAAFGNFQIFDAEGQLLLFIGSRSEKDGPAQYMLPSGVAVDEDGRIYMVDQWFRKVDVFRPASLKSGEGLAAAKAKPKP